MADQLTSIGVEFDRAEMQRVFYDVHNKTIPRYWGMGKIHNPPASTAALDKAWSGIQAKEPAPRTPGLYKRDVISAKTSGSWNPFSWDSKQSAQPLGQTNEFVHPCVRIRFAHGGKGPDDEPKYRCRALTANNYQLVQMNSPPPGLATPRPARAKDAAGPYAVVGGEVVAFWDAADRSALGALSTTPSVQVQQPVEEVDTLQVPKPGKTWVWKRPATRDPKNPDVVLENEIVLAEEQIGVWERLYMKVQEELVDWKPMYVARQTQAAAVEEAGKWAVTRAWGQLTSKKTEEDDAGQQNYDDLVVWQRGLPH